MVSDFQTWRSLVFTKHNKLSHFCFVMNLLSDMQDIHYEAEYIILMVFLCSWCVNAGSYQNTFARVTEDRFVSYDVVSTHNHLCSRCSSTSMSFFLSAFMKNLESISVVFGFLSITVIVQIPSRGCFLHNTFEIWVSLKVGSDWCVKNGYIYIYILQWIVTRDIDLPKNQNNLMKIYGALENTTWAPTQPGVKSRLI